MFHIIYYKSSESYSSDSQGAPTVIIVCVCQEVMDDLLYASYSLIVIKYRQQCFCVSVCVPPVKSPSSSSAAMWLVTEAVSLNAFISKHHLSERLQTRRPRKQAYTKKHTHTQGYRHTHTGKWKRPTWQLILQGRSDWFLPSFTPWCSDKVP